MANESKTWAEVEFHQLDLGDKRLNNRARRLMNNMAANPTVGIPGACNGWGETVAAYRFFDNERVEWEAILEPHWEQSAKRMAQESVVLCLLDTTELNYNGQQAQGLGPLSYESQRGMYLHPTYAVTPGRVPLGVLDAWMWAREKKGADGQRAGMKESRRWIEGYERLAELSATLPQTRLVYVADRESDMITLMARAQALGNPVDWLIRASHDRSLQDGDTLWAHTCEGEPIGEIEFSLASRPGVKARVVKQQVFVRRVELRNGKRQKVDATCIIAREIAAPAGVKPIEWRLLSNRPADSVAAASELIDWYRARWEIEILFNVLKNACQVEKLQLASVARIERALALYLVVAWRIAYLTRMGRTCPDLDASLFFDSDEIQAAYLLNKKKPAPNPKVNDVIRLIAQVGGFLARKGDGEPGVKTLWQGLRDVYVSAHTIKKLRELGMLQSCV